jgi:hypothetical protein
MYLISAGHLCIHNISNNLPQINLFYIISKQNSRMNIIYNVYYITQYSGYCNQKNINFILC